MATNDTGTPKGRENVPQTVCYIRKKVTFADAGVSAGVPVEWLRKGSIILGTDVVVTAAFNAATTNVLTVGTNSTAYDNIAAAADITEGSTGLTQNIKPTGAALGPLASDSQVFVKYTQSGTAATTGEAYIIIKFVNDRDK